jgi:3-hydroxyacyl-CoA dehydrogenase/enoyl-CoA hydratase/3-hydroxybutyryl-CoA epimerase
MGDKIKLTVLDRESVYVLTFDRPGSGANIFDRETLEELDEHVRALSGDTNARGVIFVSAKPSIFIAGADIHTLSAGSEADLLDFVRYGQQVFLRIARLSAVTVAAIHGAALGGGYELCLACDIRIASKERATQIGLPETSLGILPCWGGATRLPRLIGLPKALDLVLQGKRLAAVPALKAGLVDELIPREHFLRFALKHIAQGKPKRPAHAWINSALSRAMIEKRVRPDVEHRTRGHYPAVTRALDVMSRGLGLSMEHSMALEVEAIAALMKTSACRHLIGVYLQQERAKKLGLADVGLLLNQPARAKAPAQPPLRRIAVIGAGVMGSGIAQWASARGVPVLLRDVNAEQIGKGLANIQRLYREARKRHIVDDTEMRAGFDRITAVASDVPLRSTDLVIEAAVEQMDIKKKIFAGLAEQALPQTILATNTSALSVADLAAATPQPERVIGLHFFNPVHRMQLVEVIVGPQTHPLVAASALRFVQQIGKLPVLVKDAPGFVVNRILMPYLVEAGLLFAHGNALADLDRSMLDFGMPMGPMRLLDEVGLDVALHVARELNQALNGRLPVPDILPTMAGKGWLGRKSGKGFYVYPRRGDPQPHDGALALVRMEQPENRHRDELQRRMVLLMVNEAARCVEEAIVREPQDVDFAMVMGTGFAPFRGGPLHYADDQGVAEIANELLRLAESDSRFEPCGLLKEMATHHRLFYPKK